MLSYVGLGAAIMVSAVLLLVQWRKLRGLQRGTDCSDNSGAGLG